MDQYNFLEITAFIGIFVILFLALFLLTVKTKHKLGNQLFAFFLIANAIDVCKYLIHHIPENFINLEAFRWSIVYLVPASFCLYVMSICFSNFRLKTKHLLHAIPFIAYNLNLISGIYFETTAMKLHFMKSMNQMFIIHFFQILFELLFQVYFIASFLIIRNSRTVYLENYTNPNISLINALYKITIVYYLLHFLVLLRWLVTFTIGLGEVRQWIVTLDGFTFLFCTCWYLFIALNNPEFFRGVNSHLKPITEVVPKQKPSLLVAEEKNKQIEFLKDFMVEKEPYLDSSLTIQNLSEQVKMPVKDLSTLINCIHPTNYIFDASAIFLKFCG